MLLFKRQEDANGFFSGKYESDNYSIEEMINMLDTYLVDNDYTLEDSNALKSLLQRFADLDIKDVIVENGVTGLGKNMFSGMKFDTISFADSVTFLGDSCFEEARLNEFDFPSNLQALNDRVLADSSLSGVVDIPDSVAPIGGYVWW